MWDDHLHRALKYTVPKAGYYFIDAWAPKGSGAIQDDLRVWRRRYRKLTLNGASTQVVSYGQKAGITCTLRDFSGQPMIDEEPDLHVLKSVAGGDWEEYGVASNEESLQSFLETSKVKTAYKLRTLPTDFKTGAISPVKTVYPKAKLTRSSSWGTKYRSKAYTYSGYVYPQHSTSDTNKVKFKMYKKGSDGKYRLKKTVTASYGYYSGTKTKWKAKASFTSKGKWRVRAYHPIDGRNYKSYSSYDYVTVQ